MKHRWLQTGCAVLIGAGAIPGAHAQGTVAAAEAARDQVEREYRDRIAAAREEVRRARAFAAAQDRLARAEADRVAAEREIAQLAPADEAAVRAAPAAPDAPVAAAAADPVPLAAPDRAAIQQVVAEARDAETKAARVEAEAKAERNFGGLTLGAGLSLTLDIGDNDRITEAAVVNGIVRVRNADNTPARLLFESHYLFKPDRPLWGVEQGMWGVGPFVAIHPGENEIINAIGFGVMVAFRREREKTDSFNLGLGVIVDPNVQLLGEGIVANQPLPAGETLIRYRESSQVGFMAMTSFSF